jgi:hypothetical protein
MSFQTIKCEDCHFLMIELIERGHEIYGEIC